MDVLIRFIENWKQSLDNHKYAVLQNRLFIKLRNLFVRYEMSATFLLTSAARQLMCATFSQ